MARIRFDLDAQPRTSKDITVVTHDSECEGLYFRRLNFPDFSATAFYNIGNPAYRPSEYLNWDDPELNEPDDEDDLRRVSLTRYIECCSLFAASYQAQRQAFQSLTVLTTDQTTLTLCELLLATVSQGLRLSSGYARRVTTGYARKPTGVRQVGIATLDSEQVASNAGGVVPVAGWQDDIRVRSLLVLGRDKGKHVHLGTLQHDQTVARFSLISAMRQCLKRRTWTSSVGFLPHLCKNIHSNDTTRLWTIKL
ncbi:hypothetical protein IQ07DRAFT_594328 [Pyrenochaeta sp. DS3sAY3a]|nr:hypothetical protein IQ07DRAFT_594328 [Pyrenochaeta sp. DS3sAY3a]